MILRAAWVAPVSSPPIRDGYVEIAGERIVAVGRFAERFQPGLGVVAPPAASAQVHDLGDAVLIPGLVNPHTHLELSCYAGKLPSAPLWEWLHGLIGLRRAAGVSERETQAVVDGAWASLRAGVTCVGDISRTNLAWRALRPIPIRKVCFAELLTLADHPPRSPAELRDAVAAIEEDALLTAGISPHAPYSVPPEFIRAAIKLADELGRPWTMHWLETPEEAAYMRGATGVLPPMIESLALVAGVRRVAAEPADLLMRCTVGLRPGLLAHVNYPNDADIVALAGGGQTAVYCPRAHRFYQHSAHPWGRLRAAGVTVLVGTDSLAGNESLSILDELSYVRRHLADSPTPAELLQTATLDAARALGLGDRIGSLEPGKFADLAAFSCAPGTRDPIADLIDFQSADVHADQVPNRLRAVWVAGRQVV